MLKIRLRRMGSRHRPFYRIVVSDSRRAPSASALEEIGHYDPRQDPVALSVDVARADHWIGVGAKPSTTVGQLIVKARAAENAPPEEAAAKPAPKAKAEKKPEAEKAEAKTEAKTEEKAEEKAEAKTEEKAEEKAEAEKAEAEPAAETETEEQAGAEAQDAAEDGGEESAEETSEDEGSK